AHRLARRDSRAGFSPGGSGVAGASPDVRNLADAIGRDGCNDGGSLADQFSHARFARTLRLFEHGIKEQKSDGSHQNTGHCRNWRADPDVAGRLDSTEDESASAE